MSWKESIATIFAVVALFFAFAIRIMAENQQLFEYENLGGVA